MMPKVASLMRDNEPPVAIDEPFPCSRVILGIDVKCRDSSDPRRYS
jgi:hypothetical protein